MGSPSEGKAGVVRELLGDARAEYDRLQRDAAGEQIALFPVPTRFHGARAEAVQAQSERQARPGRPAGAQNLTTREFREWLLARGVSPLVALMRYAIMPPQLLAQELKCSELEAFREWRILQVELAPYMHARLALVDDQGQAVPSLTMVVGGHQVTIESGETPWTVRERLAAQVQQNQPLSLAPDAMSHAPMSHEDAK